MQRTREKLKNDLSFTNPRPNANVMRFWSSWDVAAQNDVGFRPSDAESAQYATDGRRILLAGERLARSQYGGDQFAGEPFKRESAKLILEKQRRKNAPVRKLAHLFDSTTT